MRSLGVTVTLGVSRKCLHVTESATNEVLGSLLQCVRCDALVRCCNVFNVAVLFCQLLWSYIVCSISAVGSFSFREQPVDPCISYHTIFYHWSCCSQYAADWPTLKIPGRVLKFGICLLYSQTTDTFVLIVPDFRYHDVGRYSHPVYPIFHPKRHRHFVFDVCLSTFSTHKFFWLHQ